MQLCYESYVLQERYWSISMFDVFVKGIGDDEFELMKSFDTRNEAEDYVREWKALEADDWIQESMQYEIVFSS